MGTFSQPLACFINVAALATLPLRELRAGLAEVVKHALIGDAELLAHLMEHAERIAVGDIEALEPCVTRSVVLKAGIVGRDERETGERMVLNLGHTVGHALEVASNYALSHGEAVALGLLAALRFSVRRGLCAPSLYEQIRELLVRLGLPTLLDPWLRKEVLARVAVDKKRRASRLNFVALKGPAQTEIVPLTLEELAADLLPREEQ